MRVAVVSDNGQSNVDESAEQAMGPAYIAQSAKDNGHEVKLYHRFPSSKELLSYDVVGFSANSRDVPGVLKISKEIKSAKGDLTTIVGGPHVSGKVLDWGNGCKGKKNLPFLCNPWINYFVVGEGDVTFPRLLEAIVERKEIPEGVIYRNSGEIVFTGYAPRVENLDGLSFPTEFRDSETFENQISNFQESVIMLPIIESRGCPGQKGKICSFCSSEANWGRQIRYRSGENILREVNEVVKRFGLNQKNANVFFDSLELMGNKNKFYDILDAFEGNSYTLGSCGDIRKASRETLGKMSKAGYSDILWGIESLDPNILEKYKAGLTLEKIKNGISLANSVGIKSTGMFMMGFPEETKKSIFEWSSRIGELGLESVRLSIVTPFPGTGFRNDLLKRKVGIEDYSERWDTSHLVYDHPGIGKQEVERIREEVISQFLASK